MQRTLAAVVVALRAVRLEDVVAAQLLGVELVARGRRGRGVAAGESERIEKRE
jgi:hypothetical protein